MTDINAETGEVVGGRSPRFIQWAAFLIFSSITLGAAVEEVRKLRDERLTKTPNEICNKRSHSTS
jgi:hypothetical protein